MKSPDPGNSLHLHTMALLQAYQADCLKEMDEGDGLTPEAVKELCKT